MNYSKIPLLLVLMVAQYSTAYIQNAVCPQCAGVNVPFSSSSYNGYSNIDPNPLSFFNGPTDFGNQLGMAIASRINEAYPDSASRLSFGSYPMTNFGNQGTFGGQSYVIQPDLIQQSLSGYGNQAALGGSSFPTSFSSFPGYGGFAGQQSVLPNNGYTLGNFNNLGATTYGNNFGNYGGTYGIPDPITTGGSTSGGGCPYCFGNKGGFKARKAKRAASAEKKN
ncbi:unnamed protein product [Heligmosomoides polygyrus]|uniref:Uncharacterized protein n=1 Tax=Heligmosomoides polygyrus TaxID=6339 RepID=A0A3P8E8H2_HELPZ|nr:unnamed protein product [Heligmosomoides polygyrus]